MTSTAQNSKITQPFLPSLLHLSAVKVAVLLYTNSDFFALKQAFGSIQERTYVCKYTYMSKEAKRALPKVLLIPGHLRKEVMEAVRGLYNRVQDWIGDHYYFGTFTDVKCYVSWRSDGTIDRIETSKKLILNASIDIRHRFRLACYYCLEEIIKTLWVQINASVENIKIVNPIECFWIQRMEDRSRVPWREDAVKHFASSPHYLNMLRCSSLLSTSPPKQRLLSYAVNEDFLMWLLAMDKKEEKEVLKNFGVRLLYVYMKWPLQSLFLETAEKVMKLTDGKYFIGVLYCLFSSKREWEEIKFYETFMSLWNMIPVDSREMAKRSACTGKDIASCFKEMKLLRIRKEDIQE